MAGSCRDAAIKKACDALKNAEALVLTCGAGFGVDSGLPVRTTLGPWLASSAEQSFAQDFRGNEGFWKEYPPMAKARMTFSQCADPRHFKTDPAFA